MYEKALNICIVRRMDDAPTLAEPIPDDAPAPPRSLAGTLHAALPRRTGLGGRAVSLAAFLLVAGALAEGIGWARIRQIRADATTLAEGAARAAEMHDRLAAFAAVAARPPLDAELDRIGAHLPPDTHLAEASRAPDGTLALAIDTTDPDLLRDALAGDPLLGRLRERGQERRDDGTMRVRLAGTIG